MKKHRVSLLVVLALVLAFFTTTAFTNAPQAFAATRSFAKPLGCILRIQDAGITENGPVASIGAYNAGTAPAPLQLTATRSISNQLSATIGFTAKFISGQLGFNVTAGTSYNFSFTITVNPGQTGYIYAYVDYDTYLLTNSCTGAQATARHFTNGVFYTSSVEG